MDRRKFLTILATAGMAQALAPAREAAASHLAFPYYKGSLGVLHDTTRCIGCRRCEAACQREHNLPMPALPFSDLSVTATPRRTTASAWTVVNRYEVNGSPIFRKLQCYHCNDPACAAACFAKCFTKRPDGAVVYNPKQCVGCRYCMIACPFNIPGFQYGEPFDPLILKCNFCQKRLEDGRLPACVQACPVDAITFGRRSDLIKIAHQRIEQQPGRYLDYVYGENDAGGTAWMTLAPAPATPVPADDALASQAQLAQLGLSSTLGSQPIASLTYGALALVPMIAAFWPVLFGGTYAVNRRREKEALEELKRQVMAAHEDVEGTMEIIARRIEERDGPKAARRARKAMAAFLARYPGGEKGEKS